MKTGARVTHPLYENVLEEYGQGSVVRQSNSLLGGKPEGVFSVGLGVVHPL